MQDGLAPSPPSTVVDLPILEDAEESAVPGLVVIMRDGEPACTPTRYGPGGVTIGRVSDETEVLALDDERVSRRHACATLEGERIRVRDLGSRNGTFVDGRRVKDDVLTSPKVLGVGNSLLLFASDVRPFLLRGVHVDGDLVCGPLLGRSLARVARAANAGETLLVTGPSGAGKELAARTFHEAGGREDTPFVAVNCAAIPEGLAERLLFGAVKGAYSGATGDAVGYIQSADGGTLFLDEVGELPLGLQAKLLRVLETREVVALGASRPRKVDIRLCAATLRDLRGEVAAGRFREDLYYRIARPIETIPPLSARLEEIPWLVWNEVKEVDRDLQMTRALIERCAARPWPGNVRELRAEIRQAAQSALEAGRKAVTASDLSESAGMAMATEAPPQKSEDATDEQILETLTEHGGNVTRAATALGMHRNQLRRWLTRKRIDPKTLSAPSGDRSR